MINCCGSVNGALALEDWQLLTDLNALTIIPSNYAP